MIKEQDGQAMVTTSVPVGVTAKFYWVQATKDTSRFRFKISLYVTHRKKNLTDYHMAISYYPEEGKWMNSQAPTMAKERSGELPSIEDLIKTQIIGFVTEPDLYTTILLKAAPELDGKMREFVDTLQLTPERADIHDITGYDESFVTKLNKRLNS
jgi:hypothetical protein